jgi:hypothetical protein
VVHAARAVVVEVGRRDTEALQVDTRGRTRLDAADRADMVGGDRIAEYRKRASAAKFAQT